MSDKTYKFKGILQNDGWHENVCITVDQKGIISDIAEYNRKQKVFADVQGFALPGFQNAHSHAFQYAMAGLAEHRNTDQTDDFWGWREAMYQLALSIDPDQLRDIAGMLYAEMVNRGYTHVAEFHYLHHDKNGQAYEQKAEMAASLVEAATEAGINITLIPIFYQKGGFGIPANPRQRRFRSSDIGDYQSLLEASLKICSQSDVANLGMGVHSLRAVEPDIVKQLCLDRPKAIPFHMHISEQLQEVRDSMMYLGKRPVEWVLENIEVDDDFHFVHATHLSKAEIRDLGQSMANVVLCPSTEANLGDGIFALKDFLEVNGRWSIGTDSHIGLDPFEELRLLDYGQRLKNHKRQHFGSDKEADPGQFAIRMTTNSGRKAMGASQNQYFEEGYPLNACVIDAETPLISNTSFEKLTSTMIYTNDRKYKMTISNGRIVSERGQHANQNRLERKFRRTIKTLMNR